MLKLVKIAITGGVASGKSTVCQFFKELGAYVVNADAIVHQLLKPDSHLGQQVIRLLGSEVLHNGQLDRGRIAEKVFRDPKQLKALEKILHPEVIHRIAEEYEKAVKDGSYTSFVVEIPLLFEIQGESFYDAVIAVLADET